MSNAKTKQKWSSKTVLFFSLTVLAFIASAAALFEMAVLSGWSLWIAGILPLIIDGAIVLTIMDMVETRRKGGKAGWAMFVFIFCSVASTLLNGYHSYINAVDGGLPTEIRVMIGVLPPVLLLMLTKQFEGSIERDAAVDVVTEAPAPAEPLVTEVAEAPVNDVVAVTAEPDLALSTAQSVVEAAEPDGHDERQLPVTDDLADSTAPVTESVTEEVVTEREVVTAEADAPMTEVAEVVESAPQLHAVENIPTEPAAQVEWIVDRARAGRDVSKKALLAVFEEAGQPVSDSTAQRRLREARAKAPEAFAAA